MKKILLIIILFVFVFAGAWYQDYIVITSNTSTAITLSGGTSAGIQYEGTTNEHETTLLFEDPTADRTITFPDLSGTVALYDSAYGEAYVYESSNTETVGYTEEYYAIQGELAAGLCEHFTFVAGSSGSGNITTAAAGAAINIADVAHGLVSGDYVNVQSANHAGTSVVTYVDPDNFTVAIAYVGNEAGTWQEGDYLLASAGSDGKYEIIFQITAAAGAASKNFKFEAVQNATHLDKSAFEITTSGTNHQSSSGGCFVDVTAGDRFWLQFKNETDTQDLAYQHMGLRLKRL